LAARQLEEKPAAADRDIADAVTSIRVPSDKER